MTIFSPAEHSYEDAHFYAVGVVLGDIVTGQLVRKSCQRYLDDLEHAEERGLHFDPVEAQRALDFFPILRHSKGEWAGKPFQLERWQQFVNAQLFGWRREDGARRFRTSYIEVARKNGKSVWGAGLGLFMLVADREQGSEVYAAATKRDQARIIWEEAKRMVQRSSSLRRRVRPFRSNLSVDATASKFEPLGADHDTLDGLNIHCAIIDELHAHKGPELYEVLDTATGARRQPLMFAITTAGSDQLSFCWEQHEYAEKVLAGTIEDDSFFAYIASLDEGDAWDDPAVWIKANPNLGVSVKVGKLEEEVAAAKVSPRKQNAVRRLRLNQWTRAMTRFLDIGRWDECRGDLRPEEIEEANRGRPCWAGLDLSSTTDISAYVRVWRPDDMDRGVFDVSARFWIPGADLEVRERKTRVPYIQWVDEGWIEATEGDVIDYRAIRQEVLDLADIAPTEEVAYDRWGATQVSQDLEGEGVVMVKFGQGYASMSPATKEMEKLMLERRLRHGGNPVLRWMADNLEVATNPAGDIKPVKPGHQMSHKKIDGMVALVMAVQRAVVGEASSPGPSVYENRGILWG